MPARFHERFEIAIESEAVRTRFVNRIGNRIFNGIFQYLPFSSLKYQMLTAVADELGTWFSERKGFEDYTEGDFYKTLQALEAARRAITSEHLHAKFDGLIESTLRDNELDLGIGYRDGVFIRTGAQLLDEALINESLRWLSDKKYNTVLIPFSKGLEHLLKADKNETLLSDVVTDMYEALEAMAKIVANRNRDLSANAELLIREFGCFCGV